MNDQRLSIDEVCAQLKIDNQRLYKAIKRGDLKHEVMPYSLPKGGNKQRFFVKLQDVMDFQSASKEPRSDEKQDIEKYLEEFISIFCPLQVEKVKRLLREKDEKIITAIDRSVQNMEGLPYFQWVMIKFYYGITTFKGGAEPLCEMESENG